MHPNVMNGLTTRMTTTNVPHQPIGDVEKLGEYLTAAAKLQRSCLSGEPLKQIAMMRWRFPELSLLQAKRIVDAVRSVHLGY